MATTVLLSWLHFSKTCTKVTISFSPSLFFLVATVRCQEIPRLPNQSDWLSRNFLGKNFIAQSSTRSVDSWFKLRRTSSLAWSWLDERRICAFHASICFTEFSTAYFISSLSRGETFSKAVLISLSTEGRRLHRSHLASCWCLHSEVKLQSSGWLSAYSLQWSATVDDWETWTCKERITFC